MTCQHVAQYQPVTYTLFPVTRLRLRAYVPRPCRPLGRRVLPWSAAHGREYTASEICDETCTCRKEELLFFRGFSGENEHYGFGVHLTNGTGYCSQERENSRDDQTFEIFSDAQHSKFSDGTTPDARANIQYDNPRGFSGSLVWNTRFLEVSAGEKHGRRKRRSLPGCCNDGTIRQRHCWFGG